MVIATEVGHSHVGITQNGYPILFVLVLIVYSH